MRAYPSYRDCGVEWLGDVPAHWEVRKLKLLASVNDESLDESEDPLRQITYVDIGSVDANKGITEMKEMVFEDAPSRARRLVSDGDTIVSTVRTYLRAITPICQPLPEMVVSTGFAVVRPHSLNAKYCSWALRGCFQSLRLALDLTYETQTIPQRPYRPRVGHSASLTPASQAWRTATHSRYT